MWQILRQGPYGKSVDWYALGVLIFEMLAGHTPFRLQDEHPRQTVIYERILQGPAIIPWPPTVRMFAKDLVGRLIDGDSSRRYGNMRHGADDVLAHPWFAEVDWNRMRALSYPPPYLPRILHDGDASA